MLRIVRIRLSDNPDAEVSEDGKFNVMTDKRQYLLVDLEDPSNPFKGVTTRMISQQFNSREEAVWRIDIPALKKLVGTVVKGEVVTRDVEPYEIGENTVTKYTTVVFAHESVETVFNQSDHPIVEQQTEPAVVEAVETTESVEEIAS